MYWKQSFEAVHFLCHLYMLSMWTTGSHTLNQHGMLAEFPCSHFMITMPTIYCEVAFQVNWQCLALRRHFVLVLYRVGVLIIDSFFKEFFFWRRPVTCHISAPQWLCEFAHASSPVFTDFSYTKWSPLIIQVSQAVITVVFVLYCRRSGMRSVLLEQTLCPKENLSLILLIMLLIFPNFIFQKLHSRTCKDTPSASMHKRYAHLLILPLAFKSICFTRYWQCLRTLKITQIHKYLAMLL